MPTMEPFFFEAIPPPRYDATDGQFGEGEDGEGEAGGEGGGGEREGAERDGREGGLGLGLGFATGRAQTGPAPNRRRLHNQDPEHDDEQQEDPDTNNDTRPGHDRFWWWKWGGWLLLVMASYLVIRSLIEAIHDGVPLPVIIQNRHRHYTMPSPSYDNTSDDCDEHGKDRPPPPPPLSVYPPPVPQINLTAIQSLNNTTTNTTILTNLTPVIPHHYNTTNASLTHLYHLLTHPLPCAFRALSLHHHHHRPPPLKSPPPSPPITTIQQTHSLALTLSNTHLPTLLTDFTALSPILTHALDRAKTDVENAGLPWWYVWRIRYLTTVLPFFSEPPRLSDKEEAYLAAGRRYNATLRVWEEHARNKATVEVGREVLDGLAGDLEALWRWGGGDVDGRQEVGVVGEGQDYGRAGDGEGNGGEEYGEVGDVDEGQEQQENGKEMQDSARPGSGDKKRGRRRKSSVHGLGGRGGGENHDDLASVIKSWYFGKLAAKAGMRWDEFERSWEGMVC